MPNRPESATERLAKKRVRRQLEAIRSSRDAGVWEEAREYERNLADDFAKLVVENEALRAELAQTRDIAENLVETLGG